MPLGDAGSLVDRRGNQRVSEAKLGARDVTQLCIRRRNQVLDGQTGAGRDRGGRYDLGQTCALVSRCDPEHGTRGAGQLGRSRGERVF
jgi:hypothetical protein